MASKIVETDSLDCSDRNYTCLLAGVMCKRDGKAIGLVQLAQRERIILAQTDTAADVVQEVLVISKDVSLSTPRPTNSPLQDNHDAGHVAITIVSM
jgi:hypothetical protein